MKRKKRENVEKNLKGMQIEQEENEEDGQSVEIQYFSNC